MILVTGARGMMGSYVEQAYADESLFSAGRQEFDVRDFEAGAALFERIKPKLVIHLAAETDVDLCEQDPDHANRVTVIGTQNVARLCAEHDTEMLYVSSTGVFDGSNAGLYTEFDEPNPITVYGKTKWVAEQITQRLCPRSFIIRAGWVFGGGPDREKKFVGKMVELGREREEIKAVNDKTGSPTYACDFVRHARAIVERGFYGTYHLVNQGAATRYDIACEIVKILDSRTRVLPVSSAIFPAPAQRPVNDAARNFMLELRGEDPMRPWQDALREYLLAWPAFRAPRDPHILAGSKGSDS